MRSVLVLLPPVLCCAALAAAAPPRLSLTLTRDGQPAATIIIATEATRAAQFAAHELQWHVQQVSGAELPIVREDAAVSGTRILVGSSKATAALDFKPQEYLIRFSPGVLLLAGRDKDDRGVVKYSQTPDAEALATWPGIWDEQGTMYAVYDFLERYCSVRWFNPTESGADCPQQPTLTVTGSELRRAPFFRYRYAAYPMSENYDQYTGLWPWNSEGRKRWEAAAYPELRRRFQGGAYTVAKRGWNQLFRMRHREGGEICLGNHSLYGYYARFWEAEKGKEALFEDKHPDWFAQGYAGKPPQMCYTSRGLIEQVARDAREYFDTGKSRPGAVNSGDFFCVEPMDNSSFCKCAECQKWLTGQDADSPFFSNGRNSDYFFNFVNEVAKEVGQTHPDKRIVCLAYMSHAEPPTKVKLEPNVVVQYCFACHRLNYDRPSYEHEWAQLKRWRQREPRRPLYLWLYYTFPVEIANNGKFHCFPGFFAHAIGEQFDLFRQLKLSGMFHCGYGQEVEAYVTYRLMDDPDLRVDDLLDEYFTRLYGPAAGPMRKLYETIEQTYADPASYPEAIATKRLEGHHHQTEEMAWGYLGNEQRMAELAKLMAEAQAAAQTPEHKHRVELFALGTWDYMVAGRQLYMEHAKARYGGQSAVLRVPYSAISPGAWQAVDLTESEALALTGWRSWIAEPSRRKVSARLLNDGEYLYLQLQEEGIGLTRLKSPEDITSGDYWEVLLATQRGQPVRQLLIGRRNLLLDGVAPEVPVMHKQDRGRWLVSGTFPLPMLFPDLSPGGHIYMNVARRSAGSDDEPVWSPTFGEFEEPAALRELILDPAGTIPAGLLSARELELLDTQSLVARWRLDEGQGALVKSDGPDALTGKLTNGAGWVKEGARSVVRLEDSRRQCLDFGNAPALNLTGPLSLLMWVKYEPTDTWYPGLLGKGYEASGTYGLHLRPGHTPWFEIDSPDGTRNIHNPTDLPLTAGQWCHVAATYDGNMMRVYVNGREAGSGKAVTTTIRTTAEPLRFGWLGSYGHFNGCVRDLSLYSRALPAAEIFARYRAGQ